MRRRVSQPFSGTIGSGLYGKDDSALLITGLTILMQSRAGMGAYGVHCIGRFENRINPNQPSFL